MLSYCLLLSNIRNILNLVKEGLLSRLKDLKDVCKGPTLEFIAIVRCV